MNAFDYDVESKDDMQIPSLSASRRVGESPCRRVVRLPQVKTCHLGCKQCDQSIFSASVGSPVLPASDM